MKRIVPFLIPFMLACSVFGQGPIDPVDVPQPTMKTLDQIEPRHAIESLPYVIEKSGSYYLTGNAMLGSTNEHGITVRANNVVLDLGGFTLEGPTDGDGEPLYTSGSAIYQEDAYRMLTVKNGGIQKWDDQDTEGAGMLRLLGTGNQIENMTVRFCSRGIETGPQAVVENCRVLDIAENEETFGIRAGPGSLVKDCTVASVLGYPATGIGVGSHGAVSACTVVSNRSLSGTQSTGILLGAYGLAENCTVQGPVGGGLAEGFEAGDFARVNRSTAQHCVYGFFLGERASATDCGASACSDTGFYVYEGGTMIERCTAQDNTNGFSVAHNSVVRDCIAMDNLIQGIDVRDADNVIVGNACNNNGSSGIFVGGNENRIEGNHANRNEYGIYFRYWSPESHAQRNWVAKNTAGDNRTQNYFVGADNAIAPIEPSGAAAFTNAWSNFEL